MNTFNCDRMNLRLSLRGFLVVVLVGGAALGLWGRYVFHDFTISRHLRMKNGTNVIAEFHSIRPQTPPQIMLVIPRGLFHGSGTGAGGARVTVGQHFATRNETDKIEISKHGVLTFNGEPRRVQSGKRVFLYTADRELVPISIEEEQLAGIYARDLQYFDSTEVYQKHLATVVGQEIKKWEDRERSMYLQR